MTDNPYQSPSVKQVGPAAPSPFSISRALLTVLTSTFVFAGLGAVIGLALGSFLPDYYRNVFAGGGRPGFNPQSVGLGLGLTQGTVGGVVVGLVLVYYAMVAMVPSANFLRLNLPGLPPVIEEGADPAAGTPAPADGTTPAPASGTPAGTN